MGMGSITWACLVLTVHQGPSDETHLNARGFEIPIRFNAAQRADIRKLFLYVSENEGEWQVKKEARPDEKSFVFHAPRDGKYWFIVGTEDTKGNTYPVDPMRVKPNQKVIVDTQKPRIQVTAERQSNGEVLARWTITEEYPDPGSLRVEYRTDEMASSATWRPLPFNPMSGQNSVSFNPATSGEVRVRVQLKDKAENAGEGLATVPPAGGTSAAAPEPTSFGVIPTVRADQNAAPSQLTSRQPQRGPSEPAGPSFAPIGGMPPAPASPPMTLSPPDEPHGNRLPSGAPAVAESSGSSASPAQPAETPRGALPTLKLVNKRDVKLEFEVAKIGPSGLGGADVYVTINEGATWSRLPGELPVTLPPASELHGGGPVHGSVTVQLPGEGTVYGFIVAVKSKAGLGRAAPKPNEPPQVRVELDSTAPKAQLFGPMPDPNRRNALILSWSALDRNLSGSCITLEWAERKEGPWTVIADQLPNTSATGPLPAEVSGSYLWQLPERIPSSVFLKLTVRDTAGNSAVATADKPVLIDLSVPETNITGVSPASH
jgi:hypothetical protein